MPIIIMVLIDIIVLVGLCFLVSKGVQNASRSKVESLEKEAEEITDSENL